MHRINAFSLCTLLVLASFMTGCGSKPSSSASLDASLQTAAESALQAYGERIGSPYRNPSYSIAQNDEVFATVKIEVEFRGSSESPWTQQQLTVLCKRIGKVWQCEQASLVAQAPVTPVMYPTVTVSIAPSPESSPELVATETSAPTAGVASASPTSGELGTAAELLARIEKLRYLQMSGSKLSWAKDGKQYPPCAVTEEDGYTELGMVAWHRTSNCPEQETVFSETFGSTGYSCSRSDDQAMQCLANAWPTESINERLSRIVRGESYGEEYTVVSHGHSADTYNGALCMSYSREQTWSRDPSWLGRDSVCFDPSTLIPVRWTDYVEHTRDGAKSSTRTTEWVVDDVNSTTLMEVPDVARVGIWPVANEKISVGDGWANLNIQLATVNNDSAWHSIVWHGDFGLVTQDVKTYQRYQYRGTLDHAGEANRYLPPGFATRGTAWCNGNRSTFSVDVKVADASTPVFLSVWNRRMSSFPISAQRSAATAQWLVDVGWEPPDMFPIAIEMPLMMITGLNQAANLAGQAEVSVGDFNLASDQTTIQFRLKNLQGGYGFDDHITAYILGSDGIMYDGCAEGIGGKTTAGPGQETSFSRTFPIPSSVTDRYLIVTMGLNPTTAGVVFRLD